MKKYFLHIVSALVIMLVCAGAALNDIHPTAWPFLTPEGFPKPTIDIFRNNPRTEQGFQLGKKLFYDGRLSLDGNTSCASCHQQFAAFATFDHDLSHGVNNSFSTRNAPSLANLAWMSSWQWDGGVNHLEVQPLAPLTAANEMGEKLPAILDKLRADSTYQRMYSEAFGRAGITGERTLKALAQFTGSLVSADSKYDKVKRGEATFIAPEQKGYELFLANCNGCHREPLFTDNDFHNNGLSLNRFNDAGRYAITKAAADSMKFKVPTLRNVALTFPYMHDGRFYSLDKVVDYYCSLDTTRRDLDPQLKRKIELTDKEKKQLVLFLNTLTDTSFTHNKRFMP